MSEQNEQIQKAKKVLEEISNDKRERYLAELRQKYIMDQKAIEDAWYDKGVKVGIQQGVQQITVEIAKKMREQKIDIKIISQITGLSKEEIMDLN